MTVTSNRLAALNRERRKRLRDNPYRHVGD